MEQTLIYRGKTTYRWFAFQRRRRTNREKIVTEEIKQIIENEGFNSVDFHVTSQVNRPVFCRFENKQLFKHLLKKLPNIFKVPKSPNELDFEEDIGDDLIYLVKEIQLNDSINSE